tara:strand:+ start:63 stop:944 length:882 start_codon:yes stop_codon:yes gene_type:complete
MPYIGTDINYGNIAKQTGTGDGSDTTPIAALTYTVPSNESILVFLDGVAQVPGTDFTATGTTLTFTTAPASGVAILVMFLGRSLDIGTPGDNTINLAQLASGTDGELFTWDTSGDPAKVAVGTANHVLTSNGAGAAPTFKAGGRIVQVVNVMDSALQTGTTTYPADDTIPQNTEGDEVMTLAITPTNASNKLIIQVTAGFHSHSATNNGMGIMLFQDSTAGAIAAVRDLQSLGTGPDVTTFLHYMAAGTTSSTTFKVRVGGNAAGTTTWNGIGGARKFGGVVPSSITIWEIAV